MVTGPLLIVIGLWLSFFGAAKFNLGIVVTGYLIAGFGLAMVILYFVPVP
jgi:TM2 domain-containing membrane protein YozV